MHQRNTNKPTHRPAEQRPGQATDEQKHEPAQHQGATETEVAPTTPPMKGPGDLVGETDEDDDEIDPAEELTPG